MTRHEQRERNFKNSSLSYKTGTRGISIVCINIKFVLSPTHWFSLAGQPSHANGKVIMKLMVIVYTYMKAKLQLILYTAPPIDPAHTHLARSVLWIL